MSVPGRSCIRIGMEGMRKQEVTQNSSLPPRNESTLRLPPGPGA